MTLVEALKERAIDLRNRVKPPEFGVHEIPYRTYLETLGQSDLANVRRVVSTVAELNRDFQNGQVICGCDIVSTDGTVNKLKYGVIAVGSTVRPENKRTHYPKDIDLRVVSNTPDSHHSRAASISFVREALIGEFQKSAIRYEEFEPTANNYPAETTDHKVADWISNDKDDHSFVVRFRRGLPVHVSISGMSQPDTDSHLMEERRRGGHFSILINGETESRHLYWEPKAAHENRIKKRITPRVNIAARSGMIKSLEALTDLLDTHDLDLLKYYQGLVEYTSSLAFGEHAFEDGTTTVIDWDKLPQIDFPERRYLTVISNVGESLRMGDLDRTAQILKGLRAMYGSRGESGGPPCNPEILYAIVVVKSCLDQVISAGKLGKINRTLGSDLEYQIIKIVNGYAAGDRIKVVQSLLDLGTLTDKYMENKIVNPLKPSAALLY